MVIAKRLESAAETNGILISDGVKQLLAGKDFTFTDQGAIDLKGFEEPVRAGARAGVGGGVGVGVGLWGTDHRGGRTVLPIPLRSRDRRPSSG